MKPSARAVPPNGIGLVKGLPARPDMTQSSGATMLTTDHAAAPKAPATQPHCTGRRSLAGTAASSAKIGATNSSRDGASRAGPMKLLLIACCSTMTSGYADIAARYHLYSASVAAASRRLAASDNQARAAASARK
ncbi:hypothetical protein D3C72_1576200 [compost metagenome]